MKLSYDKNIRTNILIPRKIVEENLGIVQEVIRRLDEHGLTLK